MRLKETDKGQDISAVSQRFKMLVKIHKDREGRSVVAVCDTSLYGKRFEDDKLQLDLSSQFYNGSEKSKKEIADIIRNAYIINLAGEESIKLGLEEGVIEKSQVIRIKGVPHAQSILVG